MKFSISSNLLRFFTPVSMIFIFSDYLRHNLPSPIVVYPDDHSTSIKSIFTSMISYDLKSLDHGTSLVTKAHFDVEIIDPGRSRTLSKHRKREVQV